MGRRKTTFPRIEIELADTTLLPPRRGQVVELAAGGLTAKQIAQKLGISPETVNWQLDEAKDQFGALNQRDLISQGWMRGLFRARMLAFLLMAFAMAPAMRSRPSPVNASRPPVVRNVIGRTQVSGFYA